MIKSMTAFARSEIEIEHFTVNCELRSVNHRYCDLTIKLPDTLRYLEIKVRAALSKQIKRGKVECSINYKPSDQGADTLSVNETAIKALLKATEKIEEYMHTQQSFTALDVLNFPGVQQQAEIDKYAWEQGITTLVEDALIQLVESRTNEGSQLKELITARCHKIAELVFDAQQRLPVVLEQMKSKIKLRIAELDLEPDFDRIEQEMAFLAQKLDVDEELDRLDTHVNEVLKGLESDEPIGRRLDFLMQEMNREANTLGSKSADKQMTQIAIDFKVLIEQIREQIQNIE